MAASKCPKCESTNFELKAGAPKGSKYKVMFIQCSACGSVVGVTDFYNVPSLLEIIAKRMGFKLLK